MLCPHCGSENLPAHKFCYSCGVSLRRQCPLCQTVNPPEHKFCVECGNTLTADVQRNVSDENKRHVMGQIQLPQLSALPQLLFRPKTPQWKLTGLAHAPVSILFMLACALASALVSFLLAREIGDVYRSPQGYAIVITLTVTAFALLAWRSTSFNLPNKQAPDISEWRLHLPWLLVGLAVALRYGLLEYLPPQWPIFEEIQTGTEATKIIQYSELSGHFRHTNSLAALGFLLGGYSLDGLRSLFSVAFAISLVVMAMTLRRLSVGWTATLFAVFLMTSLRFLALGGATAEEIFGA